MNQKVIKPGIVRRMVERIESSGQSVSPEMTNKLSCTIGIQRKKHFKNISYSRNLILEH